MRDAAMFARSGESDPRGKLDSRLDIPLPEAVKDDVAFVARAMGFPSACEWARSLIYRELYGRVDTIQKLVRSEAEVNGRNLG